MSIEHYERTLARLDLYKKLETAEQEIAEGAQGKAAFALLKSLKRNRE